MSPPKNSERISASYIPVTKICVDSSTGEPVYTKIKRRRTECSFNDDEQTSSSTPPTQPHYSEIEQEEEEFARQVRF